MATGMGQGGKVCFYHCCWSHLCCKVCPQLKKRRCGQVEGLSDILMLFVGSPELLVCNLFRILITFQCCLLVLFSNCIIVSNCISLKMLIGYQRSQILFNIDFSKGSSRVRERIYHVTSLVLLPDVVEQALKNFKSIEKLYLIMINYILGEETLTIFHIMWYLKIIYKRSTFKKIFSYVEQFFLKVLSKHIVCNNIDNDECNFAYLFQMVILPFEEFKK